ncbi:MAG: hypothetical protein Q8N51_20735 [Gammaproteobacteria bacterium]|nr:hypothetical protein [Gammaproteobacteria bacterium]
MTSVEMLILLVALAAFAVAVLAYVRASAAVHARAALEAYILAQQQTDIQVLFLKKSTGLYNFTLANRGTSSARDIGLRLLDDLPAASDPLRDASDRLPVGQIDPGGYFQIPVPVDERTPTHFRVRVTWTNAGGLKSLKEIPLNLID